jgi:hypothetical protein
MGLDVNSTKFLLHARSRGVDFGATATIGRQGMFLTASALGANLRAYGEPFRDEQAAALIREGGGFAEHFLRAIGAREIRSFDASHYENATDVADFNRPIAEKYKERFSVVFDGGSLEHIFNFPTAIANCMEMVAVGGYCLSTSPANNFLGHGFFQFSPELPFRIFTAENGFRVDQVLMYEDIPNAEWFAVRDPALLQRRVTLVNSQPTYIAVIAQRIARVPLFARPPQQSDYVAMWQQTRRGGEVDRPNRRGSIRRGLAAIKRCAPLAVQRALYRRLRDLSDQSFTNSEFFTRIRTP